MCKYEGCWRVLDFINSSGSKNLRQRNPSTTISHNRSFKKYVILPFESYHSYTTEELSKTEEKMLIS